MIIPPAIAEAIVAAGQRMDRLGWVPATAGNISLRLDEAHVAITRGGCHKGFLTRQDVIAVTLDGQAVDPGVRPSAETLLHCQLYRLFAPVGAVLHGHSVAATVLSMELPGDIALAGYEVLKAFGAPTHDMSLVLPVVANDQDIARLADVMEPMLLDGCPLGYLIRGHGVYVWGRDMPTALARLEGLEFLLACELERRRLA